VLTGFSASMLVSRVFHDKNPASVVEDFYLNFDVAGSKVKMALYAIALAAAFAVPQFVSLAKASPPSDASTYIVVAIAGLALGILAR
jgi:formate-dependent nitrite reductase membrane component NrfD